MLCHSRSFHWFESGDIKIGIRDYKSASEFLGIEIEEAGVRENNLQAASSKPLNTDSIVSEINSPSVDTVLMYSCKLRVVDWPVFVGFITFGSKGSLSDAVIKAR